MHGTSSVSTEKLSNLFNEGICKVNIWTALERDSLPVLFEDMIKNSLKLSDMKKQNHFFLKNYSEINLLKKVNRLLTILQQHTGRKLSSANEKYC